MPKRPKLTKPSVRRALKKKVTGLTRPKERGRDKSPSPSLPSRRTIEKVLR